MQPSITDIASFEQTIREIFEYGYEYGISKVGSAQNITTESDYRLFIAACHAGYAEAQRRVVATLLAIESESATVAGQLKEARRTKDKAAERIASGILNQLEYQNNIVRKIADGIAWTLMGGQVHIARRLWLGKKPGPLRETNLASVMEYADQVNADPRKFALLSDLTSFVQIGDLLVVDYSTLPPNLTLVECKEGEQNRKIAEFLDWYSEARCDRALHLFGATEGPKTIKQMERILKQDRRGFNVMRIANEGVGEDPATGLNIEVSDNTVRVHDYDPHLRELLTEASEKGWAIDLIDECLFVGAYTSPSGATRAFDLWLDGSKVERHSPVVNLTQSFYMPLAHPLFIRGIGKERLFDIMFGRLVCYLFLDLDGFVKLAERHGIGAKWLSRKESAKHLNVSAYEKPIHAKGRCLQLNYGGQEVLLGDGILARILFYGTKPTSALDIIKAMLEYEWKLGSHPAFRPR